MRSRSSNKYDQNTTSKHKMSKNGSKTLLKKDTSNASLKHISSQQRLAKIQEEAFLQNEKFNTSKYSQKSIISKLI